MEAKARDRAKWFIGNRLKASGVPRKVLAPAMGVSQQAVSKHMQGRVGSITYAQLRGLAKADVRAALAVLNGLRVECETAAVEGRSIETLVNELVPALDAEQAPDGLEDCAQLELTHVLGTIAFMAGRLTLPLRRELVRRLDKWITCKMDHIDAACVALARARALRTKLAEEG